MEMTSILVAMRTADVLEGRATLDMVEPALKAKVTEAYAVYTQARTAPVIDKLDNDDTLPDKPADADADKDAPQDGKPATPVAPAPAQHAAPAQPENTAPSQPGEVSANEPAA
ncbi:hypothetical protein [Lacticaseibacillus zhaodongensis]|uniref:hypothetical protein n=1 Tax=Lacticaseibacillus zhaodongensis TaxID=2668065 RepID=UPI0012D32C2E|nr:hypothetical protein [Lacticaseibacillus zhaodongensis]